ncbi:hypothetical protein [Amphritea pacifica]|uniref:hypothetical protein n=1 Tax=Amphritea pacifica TaxID=2811233 RepID=UPI0019633C7C|nr:hypothetical protein [Amphritea pacifica]MBN1008880.1 hypothetical protein [Amphritea pacifica]
MEFIKNNWIKAPILLYVIGFVVHNTYLSNFGSYEFELVQAKYILSGFGAVAFYAICFAYISIKVNLSYIFDSLHFDKIFPWLLRVVSLPYVIYSFLYLDSATDLVIEGSSLVKLSVLFFITANFVVMFSILDLVFMYSEGENLKARIIRSVFRILSVPMIIATAIIAWNNAEFSSVVKASTYFFFGFLGLGLRQEDRKYGIEPDYLDSNAKEEHQNLFTIFFGIIAIAFILWVIVSNYVAAIYPKIPAALGGAKIENAQIYSGNKIISSKLIQETSSWILYINQETGNVEKIKSNLVEKITYSEPNETTPNTYEPPRSQ